jgi:hypothetical protein
MRAVAAILMLSMLAGCGLSGKIKKLSSPEQAHYYALRVFMSDAQEKEWLKLKTVEERDAWLKENQSSLQKVGVKTSLWDSFYQYDAQDREAIAKGEVSNGWTEDKVMMAWGPPYARRRVAKRTASRSEIFVYRFEVAKDGAVMVWAPGSTETYKAVALYQYDVHVDDGVVTDMKKKDAWD